jgi:hypothetical protein
MMKEKKKHTRPYKVCYLENVFKDEEKEMK